MSINLKIFQFYNYDGSFWFRLFGFGFSGKDTQKEPLSFSERNGYAKIYRFMFWAFRFLPRST